MCIQWKGEIRRPRRIFEMVKCAMHSEIDIEPILLYCMFPFPQCTEIPNVTALNPHKEISSAGTWCTTQTHWDNHNGTCLIDLQRNLIHRHFVSFLALITVHHDIQYRQFKTNEDRKRNTKENTFFDERWKFGVQSMWWFFSCIFMFQRRCIRRR